MIFTLLAVDWEEEEEEEEEEDDDDEKVFVKCKVKAEGVRISVARGR